LQLQSQQQTIRFFDKDADNITYDLWHGYTLFDRQKKTPRYAFGQGISYAQFSYRALKARVSGDQIQVQVSITNSADIAAEEVAQVYISFPGVEAERQPKLLKGFRRVRVEAGATVTVSITIALEALKWHDPAKHCWRLEPGEYGVHVGGASDRLIGTILQL
jgi:beta-glucosidase